MNSNRLWVIGSVLAMVVVVVLGWMIGIQPQLTSASVSTAQRLTVDETNARYAAVLAKLKSDHEHLPDLQQQLAQLAASVPADTDSSAFVKELNTVAAANGVTIKSLTFADAVAYKPPVAASQPAATTSGSSSSPSPSPTATPSPSPSPTAPAAPAVVTNPLITSSNFFATPVQIGVRGSLDQVLNFLEGAQKGTRLFLVTTLNSTPSTEEGVPAGTFDATIGGYVYAVATATAGGTSATGTSSGQTPEANASK